LDEVRIHTGTQIKLKRVDEESVPAAFLERLRELAHREEAVQAVYLFAIEIPERGEQLSLALGFSKSIFHRKDDEFLRVVGEIQLLLPEDMPINLYRLESSPPVARYCLGELEPVYLRSAAWRDKMLRKVSRGA